jgi:hypothetical protein
MDGRSRKGDTRMNKLNARHQNLVDMTNEASAAADRLWNAGTVAIKTDDILNEATIEVYGLYASLEMKARLDVTVTHVDYNAETNTAEHNLYTRNS